MARQPKGTTTLLAPSWAPLATAAAALATALIGALVWHSTRLGWLDAWALRSFRADSYLEFRLASATSAGVRLLAPASDVAGGIATGVAVTLVAALLLDARLPSVARDRRAR